MKRSQYILGVDGGNSKTLAAVADSSGRVLGVGRAGNSNHQGLGVDRAIREVRVAADAALGMAGLSGDDLATAYYALAGADLEDDFALLEPALRTLPYGGSLRLNNDTIAALRAGTDNPNAVVVILGAGTNAAGRNADGQEIRLPGLGWYSGDWGGGADIAREAIRLVVRAHDGRGEPTLLTDLVLTTLDVPDVDELVARIYRKELGTGYLFQITPLVFRAAAEGDAAARDIIERSGVEVAVTGAALLRRLNLIDVPSDVVLAGSVFRGEGPLLLETVRDHLAVSAPRARIVLGETPPVLGAVFLAMDLAGVAVDESGRRRAQESYERLTGEGMASG